MFNSSQHLSFDVGFCLRNAFFLTFGNPFQQFFLLEVESVADLAVGDQALVHKFVDGWFGLHHDDARLVDPDRAG